MEDGMKNKIMEIFAVILVVAILFLMITAEGKQTNTMKDMQALAFALDNYIAEHGQAPDNRGVIFRDELLALDETREPGTGLLHDTDRWGESIWLLSGEYWAGHTICELTFTNKDYLILSSGRNKTLEGFRYNPEDPEAGFFENEDLDDLGRDLIMWNSQWLQGPRRTIEKLQKAR